MTVLDAPTFEDYMRGTSPGRHPWMLAGGGTPPVLPPETLLTHGGEPGPDDCPACGFMKVGECLCGYDWTRNVWVRRDGDR